MYSFSPNGLILPQMPKVITVLIPWLNSLCSVSSFSYPPAKKINKNSNEEAEVYFLLSDSLGLNSQHKECRGWISQFLCRCMEAIFLLAVEMKPFLRLWQKVSLSAIHWVQFSFCFTHQHCGIAFHILQPGNMKPTLVSLSCHLSFLIFSHWSVQLEYSGVICMCSYMYDMPI